MIEDYVIIVNRPGVLFEAIVLDSGRGEGCVVDRFAGTKSAVEEWIETKYEGAKRGEAV